MTELKIKRWEIKQLRHIWHLGKLLESQGIQAACDAALEERGAPPERDRMNKMANAIQRSDVQVPR
jgi:hypothetical protein